MTKDKFRVLCEQVLIPRLGDFLHVNQVDLQETLDIISSELVRIADRLDNIAVDLDHLRHDTEQ